MNNIVFNTKKEKLKNRLTNLNQKQFDKAILKSIGNDKLETFSMWQDPSIEEYQNEIARLNNCINKIQDIINEYDFSIKEEWYVEPENWELDENCYAPSYIDLHKICLILKELKEEGKDK